jgi:hypothetical protein
MPANTSSTLYRIDECPDVMADACVGDDQGNLIFLSIWARTPPSSSSSLA